MKNKMTDVYVVKVERFQPSLCYCLTIISCVSIFGLVCSFVDYQTDLFADSKDGDVIAMFVFGVPLLMIAFGIFVWLCTLYFRKFHPNMSCGCRRCCEEGRASYQKIIG